MADIKDLFNSMAEEYDDIEDLWYSWLFSRLHYLIAITILRKNPPKRVLDIGCGTGFQSFLYASAGCDVCGIDIAHDLIEIAKKKIQTFQPNKSQLFPPYFEYVKKYNYFINNLISNSGGSKSYIPPKFSIGDAVNIHFNNEEFDHVNCCGSTLSFIPDYRKAISEMARVLKRKGSFIVEVENRWNFTILWYLIDPLIRGKYELNTDFKIGLKLLAKKFTHNSWINFPFSDKSKPVNMKLNLFTAYSLKRELFNYGLKVEKKSSIHSITNLIPCTLLDCSKPSKKLISRFKFLAALEEKLFFKMPGSSLVLYGHKI